MDIHALTCYGFSIQGCPFILGWPTKVNLTYVNPTNVKITYVNIININITYVNQTWLTWPTLT